MVITGGKFVNSALVTISTIFIINRDSSLTVILVKSLHENFVKLQT